MTMSETGGVSSPERPDINQMQQPHWDINDAKLPVVDKYEVWQEWPEGHCRYVYSSSQEEARRHTSGWAMRNTNNHNVNILKKSCLGVLICNRRCKIDGAHTITLRPAICDKARKKQIGKPCPNPRCQGQLELQPCRGHSGFPVTHFWRQTNGAIYFQAKGVHDHQKPEVKASAQARRQYFSASEDLLLATLSTRGRPVSRKRSYGSPTGPAAKLPKLDCVTGKEVLCSCPPFECLCMNNQVPPAVTLSPVGEVYGSSTIQVSPAGGEMIATGLPEYQSSYNYQNYISKQPTDYSMYQPPASAQTWTDQAVHSLASLTHGTEQSASIYSQMSHTEYANRTTMAYQTHEPPKDKSTWQTYAQDFFDDLEFNCVSDILSLDQPIDKSRDHVRSFVETSPSSPKKSYVDHMPNDSFSSQCSSSNSGSELYSQTPVKGAPEWYPTESKPTLLVDVNCNDFSHIPQQQTLVPLNSSPVFTELKPYRTTPNTTDSTTHWTVKEDLSTKVNTEMTIPTSVYMEKSAFLPYRQDSPYSHDITTEEQRVVKNTSPVTIVSSNSDWQNTRHCATFHQ